MIIKNNNKAVDVQKKQRVCWECQKTSRRFYVKKTVSYGKWTTHKEPQTIPSISWEGGTTVNCKCWVERTNTVREGFVISPVTEKHYLIPSFSGIASDCRVNTTGNKEDGFTFTFGKRDNATSDRTYTDTAQYTDETGSYSITVTVTQTKRNKYVTKLDNASITTNLIPASGGNISSGILTFRKTYNTGETENVTENITFSTVSATTKGTTESGVTDVKTIAAGGTIQKQTTIDGVTLTHPSFTVKQAANTKQASNPTSTNLSVSVSPTSFDYKGGSATLTATLIKKFNVTWTSGATSTNPTNTNVTSSTTFSGTYREYGQTQQNTFSFTGNKPTIPNIQSSKTSRTYTFTGKYSSYSDTATASQTGNTTLYTVTWNLNGGNIGGDTSNKTESVEYGSTVSFTKYTPVKTGYTFNGWSTSSTATSGSSSGSSSHITANTTFYATWKSATLTPILLVLA